MRCRIFRRFFNFLLVFILIFISLLIPSFSLETERLGEVVIPLKDIPPPCSKVLSGFAFSEKEGTLPHYTAYKLDPLTKEKVVFGFCFVSTDIVPEKEYKLQPMQVLIGLALNKSIINFLILEENEYKPYLFFDLNWHEQLKQKSINDPWMYGADIELLPYIYRRTHIEQKAFALIDALLEPSRKIANIYIDEEVLQKAQDYVLHVQQFEDKRTAENNEQARQVLTQPSQDMIIQDVMERKVAELVDKYDNKKYDDEANVSDVSSESENFLYEDNNDPPDNSSNKSYSLFQNFYFWLAVILVIILIIVLVIDNCGN